ncbi:MAG: DsrE/DsrF/DrsH-like family protein [Chromatiaceae bacterium]|nr:DsrE/DsrF/DrsH-like family protein [Gammaproteobacteria bacterium]MCB1861666.1 DsrE/DsrF/DrsH-like family protein [Gammaproteobacteria bacterium]MCB1881388.1 DsrE/DsrF/DrsH-like family protein [Gammaproteobacteria bacterium]MCB1902518.1 DsrE/DsrF/DrsH-like family protein [Gammaproteobacteria bacterium]MCP5445404.1 DsrE/DsrF/DrsH-like family protein [Chromatiaceae bacterium]
MSLASGNENTTHLETESKRFNQLFDARFAEKITELKSAEAASLSIMVTKGTLDWAYPPFIIASTASALGWNVTLFFTFYGLNLLKKRLDLKLSGLGNPAMPMKMPYGPAWLREIEWNIPNLVMANIPGFETFSASMMRKTLSEKGVAPVSELRQLCIEEGVKLIACQMTADLFGWPKSAFIDEISEWAGAATYLSVAQNNRVNLYM